MEIGELQQKKKNREQWRDQNYIKYKIEKPKIQLNLNITLPFFLG
jgi:hypothetical protein